ncbi:hypothetical protein Tco_0213544 [Tanacetum coccineum]
MELERFSATMLWISFTMLKNGGFVMRGDQDPQTVFSVLLDYALWEVIENVPGSCILILGFMGTDCKGEEIARQWNDMRKEQRVMSEAKFAPCKKNMVQYIGKNQGKNYKIVISKGIVFIMRLGQLFERFWEFYQNIEPMASYGSEKRKVSERLNKDTVMALGPQSSLVSRAYALRNFDQEEVIENGNSWVPIPVTSLEETGTSTGTKMNVPLLMLKKKTCIKNVVKAKKSTAHGSTQ